MDVQSVIDNVSRTLIDEGTVRRWSEVELISHLNSAIRETITQKPSAYTVTEHVQLASGYKQTAPTGSIFIHDIVCSSFGEGFSYQAITLIDRETLNDLIPTWMATPESVYARHWMYNPAVDVDTYWIYPPADGLGSVEMIYTSIPTELTDVTDTVPLDDMYVNALMEFMLFRCFEKDADNPNAAVRAQAHFQLFANLLGVKLQIEQFMDPNIQADPNVKEVDN